MILLDRLCAIIYIRVFTTACGFCSYNSCGDAALTQLHFQAGFAAAWGNVFKSECAAKNIEVQFSTIDEAKIMDDDIHSRFAALYGPTLTELK
jgi:hypothetical protein